MTRQSLSLLELADVFREEEMDKPSPSLASLPDVVLHHLAPYLPWTSRRSVSQLNCRFRRHFAPLLNQGRCLSVKGHEAVGVGDREHGPGLSCLFEFYTVHVEMDDEMHVDWTIKLESGVRTVVNVRYDGNTETRTSRSIAVSSREYLERLLQTILRRFQFNKIHLGVHGLRWLFEKHNQKVEDLGVSVEIEYLELAEKLKPRKLSLFQPTQNHYRRGKLDLSKFPQLEELRMYGVPLDLDQLVESKLTRVTADTIDKKIKLTHAAKLIDNWKRGILNYKKIRISSEVSRVPIRVPYQQWSALQNARHENDSFYDDVLNNRQKVGSFWYSPENLEFVAWDENGQSATW